MNPERSERIEIPVLPLRDVVVLSLIHISTIIDEFSRVFSHIGSNSSSVPGDPLITN